MMIDTAIIPFKEHFNALDAPRAQHSVEPILRDAVECGLPRSRDSGDLAGVRAWQQSR